MRVLMLGPALDVMGGVSTIERMMLTEQPAGFDIEMQRTMRDTSLPARLTYWAWRMVTVPIRAVWRRPKVVHLHISHGPSAFRKLTLGMLYWMAGCKVVHHIHSVDTRVFPKRSFLTRGLTRFLYRRASHFIVLNRAWRDSYSQVLGVDADRFTVLSNPVDLPERVPEHPVGEQVQLLFTGRLETLKGVDELLPAFAEVHADGQNPIRLVLAGDGDVARYRQMAEELGVADAVEFPGWVEAEELERLQADSHVYVLPSHTEGLPMGMLEAMARELAVVVTPVGGIPELIEDGVNGLLVPKQDSAALALALQKVIADDELRSSLAAAGRASATEHGIEPYMRQVAEVWQSVSEGRTSA